jgi:hypothetical protein
MFIDLRQFNYDIIFKHKRETAFTQSYIGHLYFLCAGAGEASVLTCMNLLLQLQVSA